MITVFTPTYNRAHLLSRVYKSLCELDFNSNLSTELLSKSKSESESTFEWLIVDDGSTDNTEEVVSGFIQEGKIPIRYFKKQNGGKHTAINLGAKEAKGELFWILDSDDSLPKDALSVVAKWWDSLDDLNIDSDVDIDSDERRSKSRSVSKSKIAGICGYMAHHDGKVIGSPIVEAGTIVSSLEMRHKLHVTGDMMEVWRTDVMREFPFPEIPNERFCPEALVWNRIATKYPLYMIPDVIYYRDYLDGGLTDNIVKIRMKSPIASMMTYAELFDVESNLNPNANLNFKLPFKQKVKAAINYWRFAFCAKNRDVKIKGWGNLLAPLGWLMHLRDLSRF